MSTVKSIFFQIIRRKESLLFLVLLIAFISLISGLLGNVHVTAGSLDYIPIAPSSIVMLITLSVSFLININLNKSQVISSLVALFVIIDVIYCCIIFSEYIFDLNWDIEYILVKDPQRFGNVFIGRMSPISSLLFILIGLGILSNRQNNSNTIKYIGGSFSLLVFLSSSVILLGYLYKVPLLYGSKIIPVSLPASICFLLFSITLLRLYESKFWTFNLIKANTVTLQLLKTFLPIVVFAVIIQGYVDATFQVNDKYPTLSAVTILLFFIAIIVFVVIKVSENIGDKLHLAEQKLNESERKYRTLVDNAGDGIGYVNLNEEFIFANSAAEEIFGAGKGELVGKNLKEFLSDVQYSKILNQTRIRKETGGSSYEIELTLPDGKNRMIHITAVPHLDVDGKVSGTLGVFRDISESKRVELALKENEKKLLQLNLNKDRFISILGHDLKNPFNNILGFSEVLSQDIRNLNAAEIEDIAKNINKSARITNKLLEDILMWAKTQQGIIDFEPKYLNFKNTCVETLAILNMTASAKSISVHCIAADQLIVFADLNMLKTVLRNLVSNAIKFTNQGGAINIKAEQNSENITISVSDNGVGIPPDNLAKLFDISQVLTTKGTAEETGTGLGLLLCKEFVEKHGGIIRVESMEGKGSEFIITLPKEESLSSH